MFSHHHGEMLKETLALVLAGGRGERLYPLTQDRTKGAVPFGGMYRLIDFTLSNCLHSGLQRIAVLPQFKYASLERHLRLGWNFFHPEQGGSLDLIPPQQRIHDGWYLGTADAVYQNIYTLYQETPEYILILTSDHVYRMDYSRLLAYHARSPAALTIACIEVDLEEARKYGIMEVEASNRIIAFEEKPPIPRSRPGKPGCALASMGIYVFDSRFLIEVLKEAARREESAHDFGRDIIPGLVAKDQPVYAYNVQEEEERKDFYWRDIGTIDAYWEASMDLLPPHMSFDLYDPYGSIHTCQAIWPPARVAQKDGFGSGIVDSLLCPGVTVTDARVQRSILSPGVTVDPQAEIVDSVLMDGVQIGPGARVHRAIIDKNVRVPAGCCLGTDGEEDRRRFHVSSGGVVVLPKGTDLTRETKEQEAEHAYSFYGNGYIPKRGQPFEETKKTQGVHALNSIHVSLKGG